MKNERDYNKQDVVECISNLYAFLDGIQLSSRDISSPTCITESINVLQQYHCELEKEAREAEEKDE